MEAEDKNEVQGMGKRLNKIRLVSVIPLAETGMLDMLRFFKFQI